MNSFFFWFFWRLLNNVRGRSRHGCFLLATTTANTLALALVSLLAGANVNGCYLVTGQSLGGNQSEPNPCAGEGDDCRYASYNCPPGDWHCMPMQKDAGDVDAGPPDVCGNDIVCKECENKDVPHAKQTDGGCAGQCYIDICEMPEECKKNAPDAPPVCWWFCKDYAGTWDCGKNHGGVATINFLSAEDNKDNHLCVITLWEGEKTSAIPGTPPPLTHYGDTIEPYGNDGKQLLYTIDETKFICTKVE